MRLHASSQGRALCKPACAGELGQGWRGTEQRGACSKLSHSGTAMACTCAPAHARGAECGVLEGALQVGIIWIVQVSSFIEVGCWDDPLHAIHSRRGASALAPAAHAGSQAALAALAAAGMCHSGRTVRQVRRTQTRASSSGRNVASRCKLPTTHVGTTCESEAPMTACSVSSHSFLPRHPKPAEPAGRQQQPACSYPTAVTPSAPHPSTQRPRPHAKMVPLCSRPAKKPSGRSCGTRRESTATSSQQRRGPATAHSGVQSLSYCSQSQPRERPLNTPACRHGRWRGAAFELGWASIWRRAPLLRCCLPLLRPAAERTQSAALGAAPCQCHPPSHLGGRWIRVRQALGCIAQQGGQPGCSHF